MQTNFIKQMLKNAFNIETKDVKFERCETLQNSKGKEELHIYATRKDKRPKGCIIKDYTTQTIRAFSSPHTKSVVLHLKKQRYLCKKTGKTFTSQTDFA